MNKNTGNNLKEKYTHTCFYLIIKYPGPFMKYMLWLLSKAQI